VILKWLFPGSTPKSDASPQPDYAREKKDIWDQFVPQSGQADTVQGELLRAVEKLGHEAIWNGNCNWDEGFRILLSYLRQHLLDPAVFSPEQIQRTNDVLKRLRRGSDPVMEDEVYDYLGNRVVDYYRYYGSRPHQKNAALMR
jgi:hypothetical protein